MSNRSLARSSVVSSLLAFGAFAAVSAASAEVRADSQALALCGLQPLAPIAKGDRIDDTSVPANAPALAFLVQSNAGAVDRITLKTSDGAAVASSRTTSETEVLLHPSEPLVAGKIYVVEQSATCAPSSQVLPAEAIRFRAVPGVAFPRVMGKIARSSDGSSNLELEPSAEATPWTALTRFRVRVPGSSDPGIVTGYGGGSRAISGNIPLAWMGAFCGSPNVTKLEVSATIAGQADAYATETVDVDMSAECNRQGSAVDVGADDAGGCSTSGRTSTSSLTAIVAAAALALSAALRRRRARA